MEIKNQVRCISHEIRNHLSICELYTEIIKLNLEKEGVKIESVDNAISCIKKSLKIMSNCLIDLKSTGNIVLANYDLKTILEEGIELSKVYVQDKKIKFNTVINATATVTLDDNKFTASLVNILKNAIEAIKTQGEINIVLKINKDEAKITISNNGEMISPESRKKLFDEGFTTKSTGSGLGLYICRENLRMQNAELELISSTHSKTVFEITIPLK